MKFWNWENRNFIRTAACFPAYRPWPTISNKTRKRVFLKSGGITGGDGGDDAGACSICDGHARNAAARRTSGSKRAVNGRGNRRPEVPRSRPREAHS